MNNKIFTAQDFKVKYEDFVFGEVKTVTVYALDAYHAQAVAERILNELDIMFEIKGSSRA